MFVKSQISLTHLRTMMGPWGLYQHARLSVPRVEEGYCTDDNARAVQLLVELAAHQQLVSLSENVNNFLEPCWLFVQQAQMPSGIFRNFRASDGRWLDDQGSEDTQARVARCLSTILSWDSHEERRRQAAAMLDQLLPHIQHFRCSRSLAESMIALADLPPSVMTQQTTAALQFAWQQLKSRWHKHASDQWPWFEPQLTYANAILIHGWLAGTQALSAQPDRVTMNIISRGTRWLIRTTIQGDNFVPVGNKAWYYRHAVRSRYDQQPIEAHTMFDFLLAHNKQVARSMSPAIIAAPYLWWYGSNCQRACLVNHQRGSGCDGLTAHGQNKNQGAESLLAYLRSELLFRQAPLHVRQYGERRLTQLVPRMADATFPT